MCCVVDLGGLPLHWVAASTARAMLLVEGQPVLQISEGGSKVRVAPGAHHCLQQQDCLLCLLTKQHLPEICTSCTALFGIKGLFAASLDA